MQRRQWLHKTMAIDMLHRELKHAFFRHTSLSFAERKRSKAHISLVLQLSLYNVEWVIKNFIEAAVAAFSSGTLAPAKTEGQQRP